MFVSLEKERKKVHIVSDSGEEIRDLLRILWELDDLP
jgi:hypothetical protein